MGEVRWTRRLASVLPTAFPPPERSIDTARGAHRPLARDMASSKETASAEMPPLAPHNFQFDVKYHKQECNYVYTVTAYTVDVNVTIRIPIVSANRYKW